MISFLKTFFKGTLNFLQSFIIIFLISLSIYSSYSITKSFIAKDSATLTSVENSPNSLPYVPGVSIDFEYENSDRNGSIFPETWTMSRSELDFLFPPGVGALDRVSLRKNERIFYSNITAKDSLSLENGIDLAYLNDIIVSYDKDFVYGFTSHPNDIRVFFKNLSQGLAANDDTLTYNFNGAHTPEMVSVVDSFLENPSADILIQKAISKVIGSNFARVVSPDVAVSMRNIPIKLTVDEFSESTLQFFIPFDFLGNLSSSTATVEFLPVNGTRGPIFREISFGVGHPFLLSYVRETTTEVDGSDLANKTSVLRMRLLVKNGGFFDSSLVRSESECEKCKNLGTVEHCEFKCLVDSVIDLCKCRPFTYRRLYSENNRRKALPYCTTKRYAKCLQTMAYDPARCSGKEIVPCTTIRNKLETKSGFLIDVGNQTSDAYYRVKLEVLSEQKAYILLRERPPCTWIEVLGQIGGNLGMFISFSVLGSWQLGLYLYASYKQHYENRRATSRNVSANARSALGMWLNTAKMQSEAKRDDEMHRRLEKAEKIYEDIEQRNRILKEMLCDIARQLEAGRVKIEEEIKSLWGSVRSMKKSLS